MKTLKWISLAMLVLGLCSSQVQAQCACGGGANIAPYFVNNPSVQALIVHDGDEIFYQATISVAANGCALSNIVTYIQFANGDIHYFDPYPYEPLASGESWTYDTRDYSWGTYIVDAGDRNEDDELYAYVVCTADCQVPPGGDGGGNGSIPITIVSVPCTEVTITAFPPGPVPPGTPIDLLVTEFNCGEDPIHDVSVVINDGSSDIATLLGSTAIESLADDDILEVGETMIWDVTTDASLDDIVINVTTTLTATATGLDPLDNIVTWCVDEGNPPENTICSQDEQDAVTVEVFFTPILGIEKTVDFDNDGVFTELETNYAGEDADWAITVTNLGDIAIHDIYVSDDNMGADFYGPFDLAVGAHLDIPVYTTNPTADFTNEACAQGLDQLNNTVGPVCDTAAVEVIGAPCLDIEKTVDFDNDGVFTDLETNYAGEDADWAIRVTNCGGSDIHDIYVSDDNNGTNFYGPFNLAAGAYLDIPVYTTNPTSNFTNEACAQGLDELNNTVGPVCDTAAVEILSPDTELDIKANDSDGPIEVCEGEPVTLTICEANTGEVDLTNPYVELYADLALIGTFDETSLEFTGVDVGSDGVLGVLEEWCWDVDVVVDTTTTYSAIGYGSLDGLVVTWCLDPGNPPTNTFCDEGELDDVIVNTEPCGGEGCTPGFWKNNGDKHGASAWCDRFDPGDPFSMHFALNKPLKIRGKGRSTITNPTLLQALNANGGGVNAMIRHGVAAMLNACSDCVQYAIGSPDQVISMIEDTLNGVGDYTVGELHSMFAENNEAGCPVNQHGVCVGVEED